MCVWYVLECVVKCVWCSAGDRCVCVCSIYLSGCLSVHGVIEGYASGKHVHTQKPEKYIRAPSLSHI